MQLIFLVIIIIVVHRLCVSRKKKKQAKAEQIRIAKLIQLQNYLTGMHSNSLDFSEKELLRTLKQYIHRRVQIMQDCQNILNKTKSPKTFFSRLELFFDTKREMEGLETIKPGTLQMNLATDEQFATLTNEMIDRFWMDCIEKSINATTCKAKDSKIKSFFETLDLYVDKMSQANLNHINSYKPKAEELYVKHSNM